ncbi:MAG: hypothetical protein GQ535_00645 [Rhodobacteraceae bacterium]|nr:hypothetical protein [Paracoccaceae bacterium]
MKALKLAALGLVAAQSAFAGAVTFVAPEVVAIEEPTRMGSSGAWIIPLIIAAVILLAVTQSDSGTNNA